MKKALLIGINYTSIPDKALNGCIDDIVNMRNVLIDAYDYQVSNITLLRDDTNEPTTQPTLTNIISQLKLLASQSSSLDEIWVHYSGHGSLIHNVKDTNPNELDNILVPIDYPTAGFIQEDDLLAIVQTIQCRVILLFDCCHSGSMCDLPWSIQYNSPTSYSTVKNNSIPFKNPNIFIFSGCRDNQTCADTYSKIFGEAVGAFTTAFIECLRNRRHNTSLLLLYRDVCMNLANNGYTQVPVLSLSNSLSTFILTRALPYSPPPKVTMPAPVPISVKTIIKKQMASIIGGKL